MSSRSLIGQLAPALAFAVAAAACGGGNEPAPASSGAAAPAATPAAAAVDPATAGTITGTIKLDGAAPAADAIKMNADPVCLREGKGTTTEFIVAGEGGTLQNVFVYVKDGLGNRTFPASTTPVELDQKGSH